MLGAAYEQDAIDALVNRVPRPAEPKSASAWATVRGMATAVPRGVTEAAAQVAGSLAETIGGFAQVAGAYDIGPAATPQMRQQADEARARLLRDGVSMNNDVGDALRSAGRSYAPDPATSNLAEQVLYGFARGAAKVVGGAAVAGPFGIGFAALEEANTQADALQAEGVPFVPRVAAGAVQGAGLGLAALPLVGKTLGQTAALYLAGGPGGFIAQQALTREILQNAGQEKVAMQFDPFDPVGLAVSTLVPAAFVGYGLRAQRLQRAADSLPPTLAEAEAQGAPAQPPTAQEAEAVPVPEPIPSALSPVAEAVRAYPTEAVDAAMVVNLYEQRMQANLVPDAVGRPAEQHVAALARAEEQINAGEPVRVAEMVVPAAAVAEDFPPIQPIKGSDLRGLSFDELDAMYSRAVDHNKAVSIEGIRRFFGNEKAAELSGLSMRKIDNWLSKNVTDEADDWMQARYVNEDLVKEFRAAVNDFDTESAAALGRSIALRARRIDEPGFFDTPEGLAVANALRYAKEQGWNLDEVLGSMRGRAAEWAGDDAPELFERMFRAATEPAGPAIGAASPARQALAAPAPVRPLDQFAQRLSTGLDDLRAELEAQGFRPPADTPPGGRPDAPVTQPGTDAQTTRAAATTAETTPAAGGAAAAAADLPGAGGAAAQAGRVTAQGDQAVAAQRLAEVKAQFPDLQVFMDGMEKPMPMADFLAAVQREADAEVAGAPDLMDAATCALLNGTG